MTKVFFSVAMSLDGFVGPVDPDRDKWMEQWMKLQGWQGEQKFFRENLHIGEGGETGVDNDVVKETFERTGVTIMGKRMFDGGETGWPEEAPFHTPVFVVTHQEREPWERPGGTTFYFVNDGIESALKQALEVADGRDIRIGGGGQTLIQYLNAGLVDEFTVTLVPVLLGEGIRLFERLDTGRINLVGEEAMHSPRVTHLRYTVGSR